MLQCCKFSWEYCRYTSENTLWTNIWLNQIVEFCVLVWPLRDKDETMDQSQMLQSASPEHTAIPFVWRQFSAEYKSARSKTGGYLFFFCGFLQLFPHVLGLWIICCLRRFGLSWEPLLWGSFTVSQCIWYLDSCLCFHFDKVEIHLRWQLVFCCHHFFHKKLCLNIFCRTLFLLWTRTT